MPGSWSFPGWRAIGRNVWNTAADASLFPPKVWGFGYSFNFGYAAAKGKPVAKRLGAFLLGLLFLLIVAYALAIVVWALFVLRVST